MIQFENNCKKYGISFEEQTSFLVDFERFITRESDIIKQIDAQERKNLELQQAMQTQSLKIEEHERNIENQKEQMLAQSRKQDQRIEAITEEHKEQLRHQT